jgi:hypothetical protein
LAKNEIQIKTTVRFHLTLVRIAIIKITTNNKWWQECREKGILIHCWWDCKVVQSIWKTMWRKTKHRSAIWSSDTTLRDVPEGMWLKLLQKHLHSQVYCSTIYNSQVMETDKMSHHQRMDQENVTFIHNRILLSHKEEWNFVILK